MVGGEKRTQHKGQVPRDLDGVRGKGVPSRPCTTYPSPRDTRSRPVLVLGTLEHRQGSIFSGLGTAYRWSGRNDGEEVDSPGQEPSSRRTRICTYRCIHDLALQADSR